MAKIVLHTPMHLSDNETTTEYEANDVIHVRSIIGDDEREGTEFYLKGMFERQHCLESASTLKKLIQENKTEESPFIVQSGNNNAMAVGARNQASSGTFHVGTFYREPMWWWGLFWGFVLGIPASYIASWLWALFPLK